MEKVFLKISQIKVAGLRPETIKKETMTQVISCEICEIVGNNFFPEHLRTSASVNSQNLRLDVQDTNKFHSVQGLLSRLLNSYGQRIPDYSCEKFNKIIVSNIAEIVIVQLVILDIA